MPTCSSCTNVYEPGARFCPSCGLRIIEAPKSSSDPWIGKSLPGGYVILPPGMSVPCSVCASPVPAGQKFCGECGARLSPPKPGRITQASTPTPPSIAHDTSVMNAVAFPLPLTARESEHDWLLDRLDQASSRLIAARVVGDPGVGKTRLLQEFAQTAESDGHLLVSVGPDPWYCGASYHALRAAIRALACLQEAGDQRWGWDGAPPDAEWGLSTVLAAESVRAPSALSPRHRRNAAAAALRWALQKGAERAALRSVVLPIDDLDLVDGASRNAFTDVLGSPEECVGLMVGAHGSGFSPGWLGTCPTRIISGLLREDVARLVEGTRAAELLREVEARALAPLYVEHLARFAAEGGTMPPQRLGDLIALWIALLGGGQRHVLQAVAVLGERAPITWVARLLGDPTDVAQLTRDLVRTGFVSANDQGVEATHRLVREIVDAGTPSEVRRELHAAAAELLSADSVPIEVRARFLLGAEDAFEALLLLDRVGSRSLERADTGGAIEAYGRAVAFARAQIGHPDFDDRPTPSWSSAASLPTRWCWPAGRAKPTRCCATRLRRRARSRSGLACCMHWQTCRERRRARATRVATCARPLPRRSGSARATSCTCSRKPRATGPGEMQAEHGAER